MPKNDTDKIRLLAVYNMMLAGRKMSTAQIQHELDWKFGIRCTRGAIYRDMQAIDRFIPIEAKSGPGGGFQKVDFSFGGEER